jgi:hypothetical protein
VQGKAVEQALHVQDAGLQEHMNRRSH